MSRLTRKRKAPKRFEVGSSESFSGPCTPKDHYRRYYFEAIDLVTNAIKNRFEQPGYQVYKNLQELLLKAARGHDCNKEFKAVVDVYGDDLDSSKLEVQLQHLTTHFKSHGDKQTKISLVEVFEYLKSLSMAQRM